MTDLGNNGPCSDDDGDGLIVCDPITQAEIDNSISVDSMLPEDSIPLVKYTQESVDGVARTKEKVITGHGPMIFSSDSFSMHRLLWVDGKFQGNATDDDGTSTNNEKMATLAVFKVYFQSQTKSSGEGKDRAIQRADIQVEFHGAEEGTARQPAVVGWDPFATMVRPNDTTSDNTRNYNFGGSVQGGASPVTAGANASISNTRAWQRRYFDKYRSRPVCVLSRNGKTQDYNGVQWTMEQNSLAREGVVPELLMYILLTRQDDEEYSVKITANVKRAGHLLSDNYSCVFRVSPQPISSRVPPVCHLNGMKMLPLLKRSNFEMLLSPDPQDSSLVLPWSMEEAEDGAIVSTSVEAGAKHGKGPEKMGGMSEPEWNIDGNATLNVAVPEKAENPYHRLTESKQNASKTLVEEIVRGVLHGLQGGDSPGSGDTHDDVATRMAALESRVEVMELRLAQQALFIRALSKQHER